MGALALLRHPLEMSITLRNHVNIIGSGPQTLVFAHGFGCDQTMWRALTPHFADQYRIVLFDHVGSGASDHRAYDYDKYDSLQGYADDVITLIEAHSETPVIFVGHSVSAMIGTIAAIARPALFAAQIMVAPSASMIDDGDYHGGFQKRDILDLLQALESNYLGWSSTIAPSIMGAPEQPHLSNELTDTFCRNDPEIAKHFARVTFLGDHRALLPHCETPTLIIQSTDDFLAPLSAGEFIHRHMPKSRLEVIENTGHCPHLSAPVQCIGAMTTFLDALAVNDGSVAA